MDCTIRVGKTKALISFAVTMVTAKLICVFVFRICKILVFSYRGPYTRPCQEETYPWGLLPTSDKTLAFAEASYRLETLNLYVESRETGYVGCEKQKS